MFYNGGACCPNQTSYYYPVGNYQNRNNYAIVLVLFILLETPHKIHESLQPTHRFLQ